jgi:hypothetical protein
MTCVKPYIFSDPKNVEDVIWALKPCYHNYAILILHH